MKDILLDCSLSSPETRPIICIDECQVSNILKQSESECETPCVLSPATWRKLTRSWTRTMGGAGSGRPTTARPGDGWRPPLTQGFWWDIFPLWKPSAIPVTLSHRLLNYHCRFLLCSASMSEESLGRVCGEEFPFKNLSKKIPMNSIKGHLASQGRRSQSSTRILGEPMCSSKSGGSSPLTQGFFFCNH